MGAHAEIGSPFGAPPDLDHPDTVPSSIHPTIQPLYLDKSISLPHGPEIKKKAHRKAAMDVIAHFCAFLRRGRETCSKGICVSVKFMTGCGVVVFFFLSFSSPPPRGFSKSHAPLRRKQEPEIVWPPRGPPPTHSTFRWNHQTSLAAGKTNQLQRSAGGGGSCHLMTGEVNHFLALLIQKIMLLL